MDIARQIIYRNFIANVGDEAVAAAIAGGGAAGAGITGTFLDTFDLSDADVIQWTEKRAQADGNDAGDPFYGMRRIRMAGTTYATTRALLFDELWSLRAAFNAVLAARESPLDRGYLPLYFSVPTNRNDDYPSGAIELKVLALPRGIQHVSQSDRLGGDDSDALAIPWQVTMVCKDPGIYAASPVSVDIDESVGVVVTSGVTIGTNNIITKAAHGLSAGDRITFHSLTGGTGLVTGTTYYVIAGSLTSSTFKVSLTAGGTEVDVTVLATAASYAKSFTQSGTWKNRGTYLGNFKGLFVVGPGAGQIAATVGDSSFVINVPASSGNRIVRMKDDHTVTFEESDVETLQMSVTVYAGDTTYPLIDPGESPYSFTFHGFGGVQAGGRFWFDEQYA